MDNFSYNVYESISISHILIVLFIFFLLLPLFIIISSSFVCCDEDISPFAGHIKEFLILILQTMDRLKPYISVQCNFTFLEVQFSIICCGSAVLMVRLGLKINTSWLWCGKYFAFGLRYLLLSTKTQLEMSRPSVKILSRKLSRGNERWIHRQQLHLMIVSSLTL